jgi:hypothetical protein
MICSRTRTTRAAGNDVSTSIAKHSRTPSSMMFSVRNRFPHTNDVELIFSDNGRLTYTIIGEKTDQIMLLIYKIEDGFLITDQPSSPTVEKKKFWITSENKLVLQYDEEISTFIRHKKIE